MNCAITLEELSAFSAGDATPERAREIRGHVTACLECRRGLERLAQTDEAVRVLVREPVPPATDLESRRGLVRHFRKDDEPAIMTLEDVAAFLRLSGDDLQYALSDLPAFEIGGQVRVRREKLMQWIEQREQRHRRSIRESELGRSLSDFLGKELVVLGRG